MAKWDSRVKMKLVMSMAEQKELEAKGIMGVFRQLTPYEKGLIITIYAIIISVTIVSFIAAFYVGIAYAALGGLGLVCYVLGLRHGADADHISAIDNTTRKLLQEDKRPLTVGTWFSLGHSTIVVCMIILLIFATKAITAAIPGIQAGGNIIGTLVSGFFLFAIGIINVIIVSEIYHVFKGLRDGTIKQSELDTELNKKGWITSKFQYLFKLVARPYQMYPVGVLFGLGFDTSTEVMLIGLSVGLGMTSAIPIWTILVLPLMFTCGMVFTDTTDGVMMRLAYGWAFQNPIRKIYYNLTITIMSVMVAFVVGGIEIMQIVSQELDWTAGFWIWLQNLDFETLGFGIIALFIGSWIVAMAYYNYKGYETKEIRREELPPVQ
jgi:nickel/cobalt transporter (NiCoT) family protein